MEKEAGVSRSRERRSASPRFDEDGGGGGVDRIRNLPDAVLGDIISLLPTKDGARTQILASRWRHLWRSAPLSLDCGHFGPGRLAAVLPLIITSHQGPGRRFRFPLSYVYTRDDRAAMEACLRSPALENLQDLELDFNLGLLENPVPASLSAALSRFSCTLVVLQIGHCSISDGNVLRFPLLRRLGLTHVDFLERSMHSMIAGCPSLECLMIYCCHGGRCVRINSLCLTRIAVTSIHEPSLQELVIENAPRLQTLLLLNDTKDVHVSVLFAPALQTFGCTTSRIVFGSQDIQGRQIGSLATMACTVKCLALIMPSLSLDIVTEMMRCFPCLEKLYIQCDTSGEINLWPHKHQDLSKGLDLRLKKLVLRHYRGRKSDADFVSFFLLNSSGLESITLVVQTDNQELLAKQHLKLQLENRALSGAPFHFTTLRGRRDLWYIDKVCDLALIDPFE